MLVHGSGRGAPCASHAEEIASALVTHGWVAAPGFAPPELVRALRAELLDAEEEGELRAARIGHGDQRQINLSVRGDRISWIDAEAPTAAQRAYLELLEPLRVAINARTFMGLFEWEGHLALYPPGGFYRRHLDVFADARERKVSTVLYLNDGWVVDDGGELRVYTDGPSLDAWRDVPPEAGTLAAFWSEEVYHEVRPARADRLSVTGWFRVRPERVV